MLDAGERVFIVDLRHPLELLPDPFTLPGAQHISPEALAARQQEIPRDRDIVLYCTCPSEATSAKTAFTLHKLGIERVRPLRGGFDEWKRLGFPMDAIPPLNPLLKPRRLIRIAILKWKPGSLIWIPVQRRRWMGFVNSYDTTRRAETYSKLEFSNTYHLAFCHLPDPFGYVKGTQALDFGCGAGRSTRFLNRYGFATVGVDISPEMVKQARRLDPHGDYR